MIMLVRPTERCDLDSLLEGQFRRSLAQFCPRAEIVMQQAVDDAREYGFEIAEAWSGEWGVGEDLQAQEREAALLLGHTLAMGFAAAPPRRVWVQVQDGRFARVIQYMEGPKKAKRCVLRATLMVTVTVTD
jgi:hypothetical protein